MKRDVIHMESDVWVMSERETHICEKKHTQRHTYVKRNTQWTFHSCG